MIFKQLKYVSVVGLFLVLCSLSTIVLAQFAGGSGTEEDPWQIETVEQLQEISNHLDGHFVQIADINASATADWNDGAGFEPIGESHANQFRGSYDGKDNIISDLSIHRDTIDYIGLFGYAQNVVLNDINLKNAVIVGGNYTGGLVGYFQGSISSSSVTGSIHGDDYTGGLTGLNMGHITKSYSNAHVSGNNYTGGIAGESWGIEKSYSTGEINGNEFTGGIAGMSTGLLIAAYTTGNVTGKKYTGGIAGMNGGSADPGVKSVIEQVFSTGSVSGEQISGALVGLNSIKHVTEEPMEITAGYWSAELSAVNTGLGQDYAEQWMADISEVSHEQMQAELAYTNMYRLDYNTTWQLTESFPVLSWQQPDDAIDTPVEPIIIINERAVQFSGVKIGEQQTRTFSIKNAGLDSLIGNVWLEGDKFEISNGEGEFQLAPDSSQVISIVFSPDVVDTFNAELNIIHDASNIANPIEISVTGVGLQHTSVDEYRKIPEHIVLQQNYPNPFNPTTVINYQLPVSSNVRLEVFDMLGRRVAVLVDGQINAGSHSVQFDASNLASGMYIYRMSTPEFSKTRQMTVVK